MNLFLDSLDKDSESAMTADQEEENLCALPYITPSKNLGRFKRDYYVAVDYKKDEALNALEEKVSFVPFQVKDYFFLNSLCNRMHK